MVVDLSFCICVELKISLIAKRVSSHWSPITFSHHVTTFLFTMALFLLPPSHSHHTLHRTPTRRFSGLTCKPFLPSLFPERYMIVPVSPNAMTTLLPELSTVVRSAAPLPVEASHIAANIESVRQNFPLAILLSTIAGASTGLGGLISVQQNLSVQRLGLWQGTAAGFMLSVSFVDLMPAVLQDLSPLPALVYFLLGALVFALLKFYIPEPEIEAYCKDDKAAREVLWSGILTAAGISLHNFPEGVAVCVASLRGMQFGLPLAIAIGLHNIPEGMAVALPLYYATRNKYYAMRMALLSGMAEPAGVLFVLAIIHLSGELEQSTVAKGMSAVAGIMVILSVLELFPQAVKYAGTRPAIAATFAGLATMTALMHILEYLGLSV